MANRLPFSVYDTMTPTPFTGNATPVFILDSLPAWLPENSMQLIARELNHSETAFVRLIAGAQPTTYSIRWYTPSAEEPFCGHGVLGAAHALHETTGQTSFDFVTNTGIKTSASIVSTSKKDEIERVTISMSFPCSPILKNLQPSSDVRKKFAGALGISPEKIIGIGKNALLDIIIELDPSIDFSAGAMYIDPVALLTASPSGTRSQVITSSWSADDEGDFAKRVFAYGSEDQATGSTYCALVPYWGEKLQKTEMRALQPSWRGGRGTVQWKREEDKLEVIADSVKMIEGSIIIPRGYLGSGGAKL